MAVSFVLLLFHCYFIYVNNLFCPLKKISTTFKHASVSYQNFAPGQLTLSVRIFSFPCLVNIFLFDGFFGVFYCKHHASLVPILILKCINFAVIKQCFQLIHVYKITWSLNPCYLFTLNLNVKVSFKVS